MTLSKLEKQAFDHISKLAKSYTDYPIYQAVYDAVHRLNLSEDQKNEILSPLQQVMRDVKKPITEMNEWIESFK